MKLLAFHKLFLFCLFLGLAYVLCRTIFLDLSFQFDGQKLIHFILLAPIIEELVFKGICHKEILKRLKWKFTIFSGANILTSLLFSVFHLLGNNFIHSALVFLPSLLFGLVYERYGRVTPAIVLHAAYNVNVFLI